jgi:hypothetical protein
MGRSVAWVRAGGEFAACHRPAIIPRALRIYCQYTKSDNGQQSSPSWPPTETHPRSPISNAGIRELFADGRRLAPGPERSPITHRGDQKIGGTRDQIQKQAMNVGPLRCCPEWQPHSGSPDARTQLWTTLDDSIVTTNVANQPQDC